MKVALAQINPKVGDLSGNIRQIRTSIERARQKKAALVIFPEMAITGYPLRDLLENRLLVKQNREMLQSLAKDVWGIGALVGFVDFNPDQRGKPLYNAAALLAKGKIQQLRYKTLLPTYDVFDETRYFEPARTDQIKPIVFQGKKIGVTICEDYWNDKEFWPRPLYGVDPVEKLGRMGVDFFVNLSCSPFHCGKTELRLNLLRNHVQKFHRPFLFVNQVGGNDDLIFDGNSLALDLEGALLAQAKSFAQDLLVIDTKAKGQTFWRQAPEIQNIHDALVLGLQDYARKCGFKGIVMGLSGGIDSSVTAALAVRALGSKNVLGVTMPSPYSSKGSITDSMRLAKNLGIRCTTLPITPVYRTYLKSLQKTFHGQSRDVTEENLQARIRGTLLMALSNKFGLLLLTTGNKSELSMGYCTLYGDMNGGLAVISDVPKMTVYALGRFINQQHAVIPEDCFSKPPSAELRPHQTDQDTLPPYEVLDAIIEAYVEQGLEVDDISARGYPKSLVRKILTTIDRNEYKRRQAPPGLRITPKAFGLGRRMPIARGDFRK